LVEANRTKELLKDRKAPSDNRKRFEPQIVDTTVTGCGWNAHRQCRSTIAYDLADPDGKPMPRRDGIVLVQPRSAACPPVAKAPRRAGIVTYAVFRVMHRA
jgi:hypothetical protein